jgi:hypothetical protein
MQKQSAVQAEEADNKINSNNEKRTHELTG